jgi:myo-inositol 2-dehydrogenase/D-chiro-inositol 1-dehydrogenase
VSGVPRRLRLGILGMGSVAQAVHLPLLARRSHLLEVAAVCDLEQVVLHAIGDRYGIARDRRFTSSLGEHKTPERRHRP